MTVPHFTAAQLAAYHEQGVLLLPHVFSFEEIGWVRDEARVVALRRGQPGRVKGTEPWAYEAPEGTIYGAHLGEASFRKLTGHPRLVGAALQLLADDLYVHQSRLVPRFAEFPTDVLWRRDFQTWRTIDGFAAPRALTAAVVLGDAGARSPLLHAAIGSHRGSSEGTAATVALEAPVGSVVFYHADLAYAFNQPGDRRSPPLFLVSYNAVANRPPQAARPAIYAADAAEPPAVEADDCMWPSAWCAAG